MYDGKYIHFMRSTCEECGTYLPCIRRENHLCAECDQNYKKCKSRCRYPCRTPEERDKIFKKMGVNIDELEL